MSDPQDVARNIFINDENELRSGWRVLIFFLSLFIVSAIFTVFGKVLATVFPSIAFIFIAPSNLEYAPNENLIHLGVSNLMTLAAAVITSGICARALERRSLGSIGFKLHRSWLWDFAIGSLMGAASLAIAVGIAASVNSITFVVQTREWEPLLRGFVIAFLFFLLAGATEELIFRGFPFQALVHNLGGLIAVTITSLIFGLAHISNPGATAFSTINTMLAGIWLGVAYLMTRSLWLATALHWSWNFAMVFFFGLPVSGLTTLEEVAWLRGIVGEPSWVSGGSYGPEGGVAATVALLLSTVAIWKSGLFTASAEMLNAIRHRKPEPAYVSVTPALEQFPASDSGAGGEPGT